jgi:ANTAR domain
MPMSSSSTFQIGQDSSDFDASSVKGDVCLGAVLSTIDNIVESVDPNVVFGSVTALCVPIICDDATFAIRQSEPAVASAADATTMGASVPEQAAGGLRLSVVPRLDNVMPRSGPVLSDDSVMAAISVPPVEGYAGYQGVLALRFYGYRPASTQALLAQLIVERATSVLRQARLAARLAAETARAENLQLALASNREIGVAIGILMLRHKLTDAQSFDLLRRVSQHSHRKLRDVAFEVARTGEVVLPSGVNVADHMARPKPPIR